MSISRLLCMIALLVAARGINSATLPDFSGAEVVERGFCSVDETVVECMEVKKQEKNFLVMHEGYIIYFIFRIKPGAVKPYQPDSLEQLYPAQGTEV